MQLFLFFSWIFCFIISKTKTFTLSFFLIIFNHVNQNHLVLKNYKNIDFYVTHFTLNRINIKQNRNSNYFQLKYK